MLPACLVSNYPGKQSSFDISAILLTSDMLWRFLLIVWLPRLCVVRVFPVQEGCLDPLH